jgi:RNA polymerase sigma-70 factor (ECF subfamily)
MQEHCMADREDDVLRRLRAGDRLAFEALFRRHAEALWRYAWARTHSRADAADIVQDTFLRAWKSAATYAGKAAVSTWLFAIARSTAIDCARQKQRRRREQAAEPGIFRLVPAAPASDEGNEQRAALRKAIADLPAAQRDVVVMCDLCDFTTRAAADALAWKETRVRVTLFRARRRLRDVLLAQGIDASRAADEGA